MKPNIKIFKLFSLSILLVCSNIGNMLYAQTGKSNEISKQILNACMSIR